MKYKEKADMSVKSIVEHVPQGSLSARSNSRPASSYFGKDGAATERSRLQQQRGQLTLS
jgi:hypothetical protein